MCVCVGGGGGGGGGGGLDEHTSTVCSKRLDKPLILYM